MLEILIKGGWWMIPLVLFSIASLAVVLDRLMVFRNYARVDNRSLRARVMELLWSGRVDEAALTCSQTPGPIAAVLLAGLQAFDKHRAKSNPHSPITMTVKEAMDDYSIHAISAVERRFAVLSTVGNAAPLLGMLGTVAGMIASFDALTTGGVSNEAVAGGISVALITTAGGLVVALMAVIPYNYFTSKSDAIDLEIEEVKAQFVDVVAQAHESEA